jgi:hypothetical protein
MCGDVKPPKDEGGPPKVMCHHPRCKQGGRMPCHIESSRDVHVASKSHHLHQTLAHDVIIKAQRPRCRRQCPRWREDAFHLCMLSKPNQVQRPPSSGWVRCGCTVQSVRFLPVVAFIHTWVMWKKSSIHLACPWVQVSSQGDVT